MLIIITKNNLNKKEKFKIINTQNTTNKKRKENKNSKYYKI